MSKINLCIYLVFISILLNGCFKIGYQIEIGSASKAKPVNDSAYYYKSPAYYTK
jgi:hypothetical protein